MQNLSRWNAYGAIALAVYFIVVGPTLFDLNLFTNAIGYISTNFIEMSLWTDPVNQSGFPETWTAFYWAWWPCSGTLDVDFYNEDFKRKNTKRDHVRYASGWKCRLHVVFRSSRRIYA